MDANFARRRLVIHLKNRVLHSIDMRIPLGPEYSVVRCSANMPGCRYQQRGKPAEEAHNVFYYLTMENTVNLDDISDPQQRQVCSGTGSLSKVAGSGAQHISPSCFGKTKCSQGFVRA